MSHVTTRPADPVAKGFAFAENPRWRDGQLWFVDIHGHDVCRMKPGGEVEVVFRTPDNPSGIGFHPDGGLLVVAVNEMKIMRWQDGALSVHADLAPLARVGLNDMLVDPDGRVYVVQYGYDWRAGDTPVAAPLLTVAPDGTPEALPHKLETGNGMALSPDGRKFYVAESPACRITVFDRAPNGTLFNRRVFAQLPDKYYPDGICIDDSGAVWASCCYGPGVVRVEDGGRITHLVPAVDGRNPFACVFGGAGRKTLYICTAPAENPEDALRDRSSRIEAIDVGFTGAGIP